MSEIQVWVLIPVVSVLLSFVWWTFRYMVSSINDRLDKLINQNEETGKELTRQNSEIVNIKSDVKTHDIRLNDHSHRIREIELIQAKCS